ncbi:hypothetical protein EDD68_1112 [Melghiribacillus thermohalophilus]|uniref:Uncharacterized protein n=1 Tax=Melghiribacillus thermohalophilus TaxID=1324956 RepID=A0A4R3MXD6_9BACI|nr:hypothetical protein EDD68_1112 [Melghiribacillus thermohalophilus]
MGILSAIPQAERFFINILKRNDSTAIKNRIDEKHR